MAIPDRDIALEVKMKSGRAQHHLDALEMEIAKWLASPHHCSIREYTDFAKALHIFQIRAGRIPEDIPLLVGDFICCLRSSLEQLAWGLAHTERKRVFTEREKRNISFLIFKQRNSTYEDRRKLFPSAVADIFDNFQPYVRGNAYRDDPLWQLNELWTMDKHRAIPTNCTQLSVTFPAPLEIWSPHVRHFDYHVEVHLPLLLFAQSKVHLKPSVTVEIFFGERMGQLEIPPIRLREINDFVRDKVMPAFLGFFP